MIRAFVAIEVPGEIKEQLADLSRKLERLGLAGRSARLEGVHLTLQFLGNIAPSQVEAMQDRLARVAQQNPPFEVQVRGVGVFPHLANPRVVWVGARANPALSQLQREVERELEALGFRAEQRPFHPHLTLMRLKSSRNRDSLVRFVTSHAKSRVGEFEVPAFHLYRSILKPDRAEYSQLASWKLGAELD